MTRVNRKETTLVMCFVIDIEVSVQLLLCSCPVLPENTRRSPPCPQLQISHIFISHDRFPMCHICQLHVGVLCTLGPLKWHYMQRCGQRGKPCICLLLDLNDEQVTNYYLVWVSFIQANLNCLPHPYRGTITVFWSMLVYSV